ncbi:unnamed protein product [Owenia fusiformis]|uniref:DUF218 domain-containing protein n=1 Tax=Owenia fusiformis TaxID=6347 RepID=A0A8J1USJ5_OWEFU|nr:unnamed protein product [Owenia fusiformis]
MADKVSENEDKIKNAQIIWDFMLMGHKLSKADLILVLGSHDIRVGEYGVQLFKDGWAARIMFSGGLGNLTHGIWDKSEADIFSDIAIKSGVPPDCILIENKSTNTGENVRFSYEILKSRNLLPKSIILVQKPYMEKRTFATFKKQWPSSADDVTISVTSPQLTFSEYPNDGVGGVDNVIKIMLGDLKRIPEYAEKGFQIPMEVPADIWKAYDNLAMLGLAPFETRYFGNAIQEYKELNKN